MRSRSRRCKTERVFVGHPSTPNRSTCLIAFATPLAWTMLGFRITRAVSSVVERLLHTQEVAGSNPASRTTFLPSKDAGIRSESQFKKKSCLSRLGHIRSNLRTKRHIKQQNGRANPDFVDCLPKYSYRGLQRLVANGSTLKPVCYTSIVATVSGPKTGTEGQYLLRMPFASF